MLAQDPDADRFAAAERGFVYPLPVASICSISAHLYHSSDGKWIVFSGDMLGAVFAARILEVSPVHEYPILKSQMRMCRCTELLESL